MSRMPEPEYDWNSLTLPAWASVYVSQLRAHAEELEAELARVQRLPELEWAQVTASITQRLAALSRHGYPEDAKAVLDALDRGKTYVNRILAAK